MPKILFYIDLLGTNLSFYIIYRLGLGAKITSQTQINSELNDIERNLKRRFKGREGVEIIKRKYKKMTDIEEDMSKSSVSLFNKK